ncbi:hypothetical protein MmTuc01_0693 [Methanosarcina mazei Tuc01]|uniref:Uncharacterized protein n=1 Tax=Methanosarcina mazei Tuc01 TaxID=1236903 RepID=M1Q1F1_METMZ|nr:hypothetical protein MmTuc01_0693 [Methanosarcina mazei Tuc01]
MNTGFYEKEILKSRKIIQRHGTLYDVPEFIGVPDIWNSLFS